MGDWQETCALTHIQINPGAPCVMVVMDKFWTEQVRKGGPDGVYGGFRMPEEFRHVEAIHRGKYNDYGWVKGVENPKEPDKRGVERPLSQRRVTIFFHAKVWDEAVKAGWAKAEEWAAREAEEQRHHEEFGRKRAKERGEEYKPSIFAKPLPTRDQMELCAVAEVAYWTRQDLLVCERFHGCQSWENEYYEVVHRLTAEMWHAQLDYERDAG